jgi:hypothetical protein
LACNCISERIITADDAEDFALFEFEGYAIDGLDGGLAADEANRQVLHLDEGRSGDGFGAAEIEAGDLVHLFVLTIAG